ncbi:hypothetical protein H5U35_08925 [Candidatus Aerophobetes bacterium]|nr:hypothetical protein [Candidatus Aerophobetes bacterium]
MDSCFCGDDREKRAGISCFRGGDEKEKLAEKSGGLFIQRSHMWDETGTFLKGV